MANQYVNLNYANPYAAQRAEVERQQKLADILAQQAREPIETTNVGDFQGQISPLSGIAKMLDAYNAKRREKENTAEALRLNEAESSERSGDMAKMAHALQGYGTPEMGEHAMAGLLASPTGEQASPEALAGALGGQKFSRAPSVQGAYEAAAGSRFPELQQFGIQGRLSQVQDEAERRRQALQAEEERKRKALEPVKVGPNEIVFNPDGTVRFGNPIAPPPPAPSDVSRLQAERDALLPNDPNRAALDARINMLTTRAPTGGSGGGSDDPFAGRTERERMLNIVMGGEPSSPAYAAAYAYLAKPQVSFDQNGRPRTVTPEMSWARPPGGQQGGGQQPNQPGQPTINAPERANVAQSLAGGFAGRMTASGKILDTVAGEGASWLGRTAEGLPLGNYAQTPEYRSFEQARRDFINAQLRRESGAAIKDSEFESADKQYFPMPGDDPAVMKQKSQNRQLAIQAMQQAAGPAYKATAQGGAASRPPRYNQQTGEFD